MEVLMKSLKILTLLMFPLVLKAESGLKARSFALNTFQEKAEGLEPVVPLYPTPSIPPDEILPIITCPTVRTCGKIHSVKSIESYRVTCALHNEREVDCTTLYKKFGPEIRDLKVEITWYYIDGCHIPGGCGSRACIRPRMGFADIGPRCE